MRRRQKSPISISPGILELLKQLQAQSQAYRVTVAGLEMGMTRVVEAEYGIDLSKDNWTLDLQAGTLSREAFAPEGRQETSTDAHPQNT